MIMAVIHIFITLTLPSWQDSGKYRCIKRLGARRAESVVRVVVKDKPPKPHIPKVLGDPGSRGVNLTWPSNEGEHVGQVDYYVVQVNANINHEPTTAR